jgi:hypothetical protein
MGYCTTETKSVPILIIGEHLPGVRFSHRRGHCTLYTILHEFDLKDPILHRMAQIINEADTVQEVFLKTDSTWA